MSFYTRKIDVLQFSDVILSGSRMLPDTERLSVEISRIDDLPYRAIVGVLVRELEVGWIRGWIRVEYSRCLPSL